MSKLAVIGKVVTINSIEGADFIRQAVVVCGDAGKWSGVVGLDIHPGDLVTVFLQDAVLPPDERWAFMAKHKNRVRMARFKGVPSECVILKIEFAADGATPEIGFDMTEALGVTKFSKPLPANMNGIAKGNFPTFIPKTDEPNFQTVPEMVAKLGDGLWVATLKCDGSSCTAWNDDATGALRVASRNLELEEFSPTGAGNAYWQVARKYDMTQIPAYCALQFEVVGPGIQGNPMGLTELEGRAFTLYDYGQHKKLAHDYLQAVADNIGMPAAEVICASDRALDADGLRKLAEVKYPNGKHGEGVVIRPMDSSWSMKVINLLYRD